VDPDHIHEFFSAFGPVVVRRMFGGLGLFADGLMFGLVADDVIYLKIDSQNEPDFVREQCPPFTYVAKNNKRAVMSYRQMPDRLYDDPDDLARWARDALAAARRAQGSRPSPAKARR
jgi:DNA transformation protein